MVVKLALRKSQERGFRWGKVNEHDLTAVSLKPNSDCDLFLIKQCCSSSKSMLHLSQPQLHTSNTFVRIRAVASKTMASIHETLHIRCHALSTDIRCADD